MDNYNHHPQQQQRRRRQRTESTSTGVVFPTLSTATILLLLSCSTLVSSFVPVSIPSSLPGSRQRQRSWISSPSSGIDYNALFASTVVPTSSASWGDCFNDDASSSTCLQAPQQGATVLKNPLDYILPKEPESPVVAMNAQNNLAIMDDYQRRKDEWALKYTSVDALRATFGPNQNKFFGDLPPSTARRMYKTLLPRALFDLYKLGVQPQDLAPLAYRARVAAKLYSRERCFLWARVAANLYDGFRSWKRYGKFNCQGMTYQQVWNKYSKLILEEDGVCDNCSPTVDPLTDQDVTAKICLKILERSCATNEMVDRMCLKNNNYGPSSMRSSKRNRRRPAAATDAELQEFTEKLEADVRNLLAPPQVVTACLLQQDEDEFREADLFEPVTSTATSQPEDTMVLSSAAFTPAAAAPVTAFMFKAAVGGNLKRYHALRKIVRIKRRLQLVTFHRPAAAA